MRRDGPGRLTSHREADRSQQSGFTTTGRGTRLPGRSPFQGICKTRRPGRLITKETISWHMSCMPFLPTLHEIDQIPPLQCLPSQIGRPDPSLPSRMMMHLFPTLLVLSSLLPRLFASTIPYHDLSRLTKPTFDLDSIHFTPAPGLPPLESIPGITVADLLAPPGGLVGRDYQTQSKGVSLRRSQQCIPDEFPVTHGPELSSYMWEQTAVLVAYNYLRLLGKTSCVVPPEGAVFVDGWVNGYFVQVLGVSKWGVQEAGGKVVASACEDIALGMEEFLGRGSGCLFPLDDYFINGGAWTARGNGDLWVST